MRSEHITHDKLASMIEALPDKLYCPEDIIAIIYAVMCAYTIVRTMRRSYSMRQ
jgi:hypothetical protein